MLLVDSFFRPFLVGFISRKLLRTCVCWKETGKCTGVSFPFILVRWTRESLSCQTSFSPTSSKRHKREGNKNSPRQSAAKEIFSVSIKAPASSSFLLSYIWGIFFFCFFFVCWKWIEVKWSDIFSWDFILVFVVKCIDNVGSL